MVFILTLLISQLLQEVKMIKQWKQLQQQGVVVEDLAREEENHVNRVEKEKNHVEDAKKVAVEDVVNFSVYIS